jgi:signal transduction histidine kinase
MMESKSKPLLVFSFGGLLLLTALGGLAGLAALERVRTGEAAQRSRYLEHTGTLHEIRTGILLSGTLARDYFLDPLAEEADTLLAELDRAERGARAALDRYAATAGAGALPLRGEVAAYWKVLDLMADMARRRRTPGVDAYFRRQLAQRRQTMLRIAADVEAALGRELRAAEAQSASMYTRLRAALIAVPLLLAVLGAAGSWLAFRRLVRLENEARALSAQLVHAQEEERRSIARELHDEVGQWLSALRLDAGHALAGNGDIPSRLRSIAELAERSVDALRRIALSLRPSMLDDLGLVAALEWQAREISSRSAMRVDVHAADVDGALPDSHRTCVFRVAQEALHNCARHSGARQVEVALRREPDRVRLRVNDDGRGFAAGRTRGLGLLGMEERVGRLRGRLLVRSAPGQGTTVTAELPL